MVAIRDPECALCQLGDRVHPEHRYGRDGLICDLRYPGDPKPKHRPKIRWNKGAAEPMIYTPSRPEEITLAEFFALMVKKPAEGEVLVQITFERETRQRCDIDNLAKLVLDAGNKILWGDDSQIAALHLSLARGVGPREACTRILVRELVAAGAML